MLRIGIFDPYLDTLGGGEKFVLTFASCLSKNNQVFIFWDDTKLLKKAQEKFSLDLEHVLCTPNIFMNTQFSKKYSSMKNYDLILFVSDGSVPWLFGKKNIILFQFPVVWANGKNILTQLKLRKIDTVICYSSFVKSYIDNIFGKKSIVIAPPVSTDLFKPLKKENMIISIGRFTKYMNAKKQDFLINAFNNAKDRLGKDVKLVLIGSSLPEDGDFVDFIQKKATKNVQILHNASFGTLKEYLGKAKIYWHAAGFGEDLIKHPERAEHFGITTVEAMASGCVPVVINAGGQAEIVDTKSGFLWKTEEEMIEKTEKLLNDKRLWEDMSKNAMKRSEIFSTEVFCKNISNLL